MQVVYDPRHVLHDPATEVQYGVAMPMYEVPARVESIRTALLTDDNFSFADPVGHGLEPVTACRRAGITSPSSARTPVPGCAACWAARLTCAQRRADVGGWLRLAA